MKLRAFLVSSGIVYAGTLVSIACSAGFYVYSLRIGNEAFGSLQSILALLFFMQAARGAAGTYVVMHAETLADVRSAARRALRLSLLLGTLIGLLFILGAANLQGFLHVESSLPFILIGISAVPGVVAGVADGVLNVRKKFVALSLSSLSIPIANVLLAIILFRDGYTALDAGIMIFGSNLASCWNLFLMKGVLGNATPARTQKDHALAEVGLLLATSLLFGASLRLDLLWARHTLSGAEAGHYALAAAIALVLYYVCSALARVTSVSLREGSAWKLLGWSYGLLIGMATLLAVGFHWIGEPLLTHLTGRDIVIEWSVLGPLFIALTCNAIIAFDFTCLNVVTKHVHLRIAALLIVVQGVALMAFGTSAIRIAEAQLVVLGGFAVIFTAALIGALRRLPSAPMSHPAEEHLARHI